jgi:hypothetical protein
VTRTSRIFRGKTLKIHAIDRVEILVELDFDFLARKVFALTLDFDPDELEEDDYSRAQHCLVVLLGGKRVMVEPEITTREQWGRSDAVGARVYLTERVHERPVGFTEGIPGHPDPVLEAAPFYNSLFPEFDVTVVRSILNGRGGKRG